MELLVTVLPLIGFAADLGLRRTKGALFAASLGLAWLASIAADVDLFTCWGHAAARVFVPS